jgi:hypothetical protein
MEEQLNLKKYEKVEDYKDLFESFGLKVTFETSKHLKTGKMHKVKIFGSTNIGRPLIEAAMDSVIGGTSVGCFIPENLKDLVRSERTLYRANNKFYGHDNNFAYFSYMHDLKRILNIIVNQFKGELNEKV